MSDTNIALVNRSSAPIAEVIRVANALNYQIQNHLYPTWQARGHVAVFSDPAEVTADYCPVELHDTLDSPGLAGVHYFDEWGRMFARVAVNGPLLPNGRRVPWSLAASHEVLELIVDPHGQRTYRGPSITHASEEVEYLAEVCDPCQHLAFARVVQGELLSDFYSRAYFQTSGAVVGRYSAYGFITRPLQILPGGYLCWRRPDGTWWRADSTGSTGPATVRQLYDFRVLPAHSLRERADYYTQLLGSSTQGQTADKKVNKALAARITKKFKELQNARKALKQRGQTQEAALQQNRTLDDRLDPGKKVGWSKARSVKLRTKF